MLAKELAKELLKNPDMPVIVQTSNTMEQGQSKVDLKYVRTGHYKKVNKQFRDAFDGINYSSEIWGYAEHSDENAVICVVID
jgi:hypothetical protein